MKTQPIKRRIKGKKQDIFRGYEQIPPSEVGETGIINFKSK
jgi:hypothetical protein